RLAGGDCPLTGPPGFELPTPHTRPLAHPPPPPPLPPFYRRWTGAETNLPELVYRSKDLILHVALSSELNMLATQLDRLSEKNRWSRDFTLNSLRRALREVMSCFEVYRPYITGPDLHDRDRRYVRRALERATRP